MGFRHLCNCPPSRGSTLYIILKLNLRKAGKCGLLIREQSGRTLFQNIWHYTQEFDAIGVLLFASGLTIFLLPFTLASTARHGWKTPYIIAMLTTGLIRLILFALYEIFLAKIPFLSTHLLTNRTVIGAYLLELTYQISYYCWNSYFTSFLQVVNNLSLAEAGYVGSTFDVVSGILLLGVGFNTRQTGYFRWMLFVTLPLYIFSQGLMIYFRRPNGYIGYIVMCQIFISVGGSIFIIVQQIAILAAADHKHVAAVLALLYVVGNIGGAVGNTISGAIWTNTFKKALERNLPSASQSKLVDIYNSLVVQLEYAVGSPTRLAIQELYGYVQARMLAAGTGIMGLALIWMFLIKNINVAKIEQVRGMVF